MDDNVLAMIYSKLAVALTDLRTRITSKNTLSFTPNSGKTINTHIVEIHPMNVVLKDIDDIEFIDWSHSNNFAQLWFCQDVQSSPILEQAIKKAIRKSQSRESADILFQDKSKNRRNQFLGFVSSHKSKTGVLVSFHIHSCAVFHALAGCTIVSCLLTTRHHILSNMQDRILQLVQLVQYRSNESFSLSITNEHVGYHVLLDNHSKNCYKTLGFDTSFRNDDSQHFIITTELPIPFHSHGNTYSWAKYGHHILPPSVNLSGLMNVKIDVTYCQCLLEFLRIDLASFHVYNFTQDHHQIFEQYFSGLMSDAVEEGTGSYLQDSSFEDLLCSEKKTQFVQDIRNMACKFTDIPLIVFVDLFRKRFQKHTYLESSLEILVHFGIKLESDNDLSTDIPGDGFKYSVWCYCCSQKITGLASIGEILVCAPVAMLDHMNLLLDQSVTDQNGISSMPLVFSSNDAFARSSKYRTSINQVVLEEPQQSVPCDKSISDRFCFCEAVKVDMAKSNVGEKIRHTLSLIKACFEVFGDAFAILEQIKSGQKESVSPRKMDNEEVLLNKSEAADGYTYEQGLIKGDGYNVSPKEALYLLEAVSVFGYRQYYNNLVTILVNVHQRVYMQSIPLQPTLLELFGLNSTVTSEYIKKKRTSPPSSDNPNSYSAVVNKRKIHVLCPEMREIQITLGKIGNMDSFYTKKGMGWSDEKIVSIFKTKSQEEAGVKVMGTSKELEEAHIQLATMKDIMMRKTHSDQRQFMIQCQTRDYEVRNSTMRKRHPTIFRSDVYEFEAISDLVLSMPYKFVNRLKEDVWTPLDKTWLKRLEHHLKECEKTSIKQIRLVRKTEAPNYTQNHNPENQYDFENNIIYEIILVDDTKLNIKYGQISDFVSDEEWINGEINCLSDIGSKRIVTLSWGAKTKDSEDHTCQQLNIGDLVTVSNQGDKWIHHAKS